MISKVDLILEEIEVLRKQLHELYIQKRSLKSLRILKMSKRLDRKLNNHQKLFVSNNLLVQKTKT
jgi:hypothetical protein